MDILKHLDKKNLHHAYLIEGAGDAVVREITNFFNNLNTNTGGNTELIKIMLDTFKIDDARNLKSYGMEKSFSSGRKVFIISANNFLLEAQNSLLKIFEEPIKNTHFFLITPDTNALLKTLVSRFYLITSKMVFGAEKSDAEKFITMTLKSRIDFIKELLVMPDEEDSVGNEIITLNSARSKSLKFLNGLEFVLHKKFISKVISDAGFFEHFFKIREFLRQSGSSTKNLMESLALITPIF